MRRQKVIATRLTGFRGELKLLRSRKECAVRRRLRRRTIRIVGVDPFFPPVGRNAPSEGDCDTTGSPTRRPTSYSRRKECAVRRRLRHFCVETLDGRVLCAVSEGMRRQKAIATRWA